MNVGQESFPFVGFTLFEGTLVFKLFTFCIVFRLFFQIEQD